MKYQIEADEVIERASRLLRAYEIVGNSARVSNCIVDRVFGDLVKNDSMYGLVDQLALFLEQFNEMPGNGLTLSIRVSREIQRVCLSQGLDNGSYVFFIALDDLVFHREAIFRIDCALLGHKVADMAIRSQYLEILAEILLYSLRLCRRFNDYQIL